MTEQAIVDKVRVIMNEAGEETTLSMLSEDTLKISDYIRESIPDAVALVQMNSPVRSVNAKMYSPVLTMMTGDGCYRADVPDDYVSLIGAKMSKWSRGCVGTSDFQSEEYKRQCNPVTRSGKNAPVCVYGPGIGGKMYIYLYPGLSGDTMEYFSYEGRYTPGSGLPLSEDDPLLLAVCYMTASLVYSIFENKQSAEKMEQIASKFIPKV